jgi:hypothetical protein
MDGCLSRQKSAADATFGQEREWLAHSYLDASSLITGIEDSFLYLIEYVFAEHFEDDVDIVGSLGGCLQEEHGVLVG